MYNIITDNVKLTVNGKSIIIEDFPYWKYNVPQGSAIQYIFKGLFGRFAPKTDAEIAIERGEEKNRILKQRITGCFEYIFYNDDFYEYVHVQFDNDNREVRFKFVDKLFDRRIGRWCIIDYYKLIQNITWFEEFKFEIEHTKYQFDKVKEECSYGEAD